MKCGPYIAISATGLILLCSCTRVLFGIKSPHPVSDSEISKGAHRYHISRPDIYCNKGTKLYYASMLQKKADLLSRAKNHMQPLQALYFDKNGEMISWHINCLAGGRLGRINWNKNHVMDVFPPVTAARPDTNIDFFHFYDMLRPIDSTGHFDPSVYDYFVIVYWNQFMERGSRKLIHTVQKNLMLAPASKVKVLWVNNENDFAHSRHMLTSADRQWVEDLLDGK